MKVLAVVAGIGAGAVVLLALGFQMGTAAYFRVADYRARRREAHERTQA